MWLSHLEARKKCFESKITPYEGVLPSTSLLRIPSFYKENPVDVLPIYCYLFFVNIYFYNAADKVADFMGPDCNVCVCVCVCVCVFVHCSTVRVTLHKCVQNNVLNDISENVCVFIWVCWYVAGGGEPAVSLNGSPAKLSLPTRSRTQSGTGHLPSPPSEPVQTQQPCSLKGSLSSDNIYTGLHGEMTSTQPPPGQGDRTTLCT